MKTKRITAIIPLEMLLPLEEHLRQVGIPGITVEHVQGYGRHPNFFRRNLMKENARAVLYAPDTEVDAIVAAITRCAREHVAPAGILAVDEIERLVDLRTGADVVASPPDGPAIWES